MSLTPIFDAVLADSEPDIFLAGDIFPRPGLAADWVREFLGIEVTPWQRILMERTPANWWPRTKGIWAAGGAG
jgi:hypothetical protein